jgi:hypothetical protein
MFIGVTGGFVMAVPVSVIAPAERLSAVPAPAPPPQLQHQDRPLPLFPVIMSGQHLSAMQHNSVHAQMGPPQIGPQMGMLPLPLPSLHMYRAPAMMGGVGSDL